MKKIIINAAILGLLAIAPAAFAQSTVTGTLSSGGSSSASGTTVTGTVGSGNSLTGTVTSPSSSSGSSGGGTTVAGNGPPAGSIGGGGGGGGGGLTVVCPNLPDNMYSLPSGYELIDGVCDPIGTSVSTVSPGVPNTGTGTTIPGVPNTGAGGNAETNDILLVVSGLLGAGAGVALLKRQFAF